MNEIQCKQTYTAYFVLICFAAATSKPNVTSTALKTVTPIPDEFKNFRISSLENTGRQN